MKAGARRIGDDDRRGDTVADEGGQNVADLASQKRTVVDPVRARVASGVVHGRGRDLDAVHVAAAPGQEQTDRARTRVKVEDRLLARQLTRLLHQPEQDRKSTRLNSSHTVI